VNYFELSKKVIEWARDRNLIEGSTPQAQFLKLVEEWQEVNIAISDEERIKEIGDFHVIGIIMLAQMGQEDLDVRVSFDSLEWFDLLGNIASGIAKSDSRVWVCVVAAMNCINDFLPSGVDPADALQAAYDNIKDRKGKMVDGVFIKESDL